MNARVITKNVEIEDRRFVVKKYTAMDGLKVAKLILAKVIPVFQDFMPLLKNRQNGELKAEAESNMIAEVVENFSLDTVAAALEKISGDDFDYIVSKSLQSITEVLPAGESPVMYANGTFGVENVEYDPILVLRLTCEAVMWSCGDFFDGNRLTSVMKPLFNGSQQNR